MLLIISLSSCNFALSNAANKHHVPVLLLEHLLKVCQQLATLGHQFIVCWERIALVCLPVPTLATKAVNCWVNAALCSLQSGQKIERLGIQAGPMQ